MNGALAPPRSPGVSHRRASTRPHINRTECTECHLVVFGACSRRERHDRPLSHTTELFGRVWGDRLELLPCARSPCPRPPLPFPRIPPPPPSPPPSLLGACSLRRAYARSTRAAAPARAHPKARLSSPAPNTNKHVCTLDAVRGARPCYPPRPRRLPLSLRSVCAETRAPHKERCFFGGISRRSSRWVALALPPRSDVRVAARLDRYSSPTASAVA